MAKRDLSLRRADDRLAGRVVALEDLWLGKRGEEPQDRLIKIGAALFDKLHCRGCDQRLGH